MSRRTDLTFLVYDFEVWKYDWIVTFKNHWTKETATFHNDRDGLLDYLNKHNDAILVGYNNARYDDWILFAIQNDCDPFKVSKYLIEDKGTPYLYPQFRFKKKQIISYDIMRDVTTTVGLMNFSLKHLEGSMALKIMESTIPWDLDRPLNETELKEAIYYNIHDTEATDYLFSKFGARIDAHIALIEHYGLSPYDLIKTGSQKAALIFKAQPIERYETFNYVAPEVLRKNLNPKLISLYEDKIFSTEKTNNLKHTETLQNLKVEFGLGGLHGALSGFRYKGKVWNLDVDSFYPSLMIQYNYISRACPNGVKFLEEMRKQRLEYKKQKHVLDLALKLIIVAIYGNMAYKNAGMWDQAKQMSICITGQLMLFWLAELLSPYATIVQVNTDGIMFVPHNEEEIKRLWKHWENETKMTLELTEGVEIIQKDVNNYIFLLKDKSEIDPDDKINGDKYIKAKGNFVRWWNKKIHEDDQFVAHQNFSNTLTVLDEAVVKYLVWEIPVRETLLKCKDPMRFSTVVRLQGKYKMAFYGDELIPGKTFRVLFTKSGKMLYKAYEKDGEIKKEKFANVSPNSIILNDDLRNKSLEDFNLDLDLDYYEELAQKQIELFTKGK